MQFAFSLFEYLFGFPALIGYLRQEEQPCGCLRWRSAMKNTGCKTCLEMTWPLLPDDSKNKIAVQLLRLVLRRLMAAEVFEKGNASTRSGRTRIMEISIHEPCQTS
jgi:hypothetical protein